MDGFYRSLGASSVAEGIIQNVGLREHSVVPLFASAKTSAFPQRGARLAFGVLRRAIGVWTMSSLWITDWALQLPDWLGFRMLPGLPGVCKDWNAVRVQGLVGL